MKWTECILLKTEYIQDPLNERIPFKRIPAKVTKCRPAPWTVADMQLYGREITQTEQALLIPITYRLFPAGITHVRVDGKDFEITEVADLGRMTMVIVKKHRTGK